MKKIILVILQAIFATLSIQAQQKIPLNELIGTWKVLSMDIPGKMYFNYETDSVWIKPEEGDDSTLIAFKHGMMRESLKVQADKMNFIIGSDGIMFEGSDTTDYNPKKMGVYDPEKSLFRLKNEDSGESKEVKLSLDGAILIMSSVDEDGLVTIRCRKRS